MSNEELAVLIQSGKKEYIGQLWNQCEKFIAMKANRWHKNSPYFNQVEAEDLQSEGYFALLDAVRRFQPEKEYKFLTYLNKTLQHQFRKTQRKRDAFLYAESMESEVTEDGDITLIDCIEDKNAFKSFENVVEREFISYAGELLAEACRCLLSPAQLKVVSAYLQTNTLTDAAKLLGMAKQNITNVLRSVSYRLRHCSYTRKLKEAWLDLPKEFEYGAEGLKHTSLQFYKDTGYSSVERAAELHEKIKKRG